MMWRDEREIARKTKRPYLFLDNPNWMVREGLLKNVNVNYELLKELSKDDSIFIREALAKKFVLSQKNNKAQAKRLIDFIDENMIGD